MKTIKIMSEDVFTTKNNSTLRIYTGQSKFKISSYLISGNSPVLPNKMALRPGTLICKFLPDVLNISPGGIS